MVEDGAFSHKIYNFVGDSKSGRASKSQDCSKVTLILRNWWTLPLDGVALGRVCVCSLRSRLIYTTVDSNLHYSSMKSYLQFNANKTQSRL